ncbi:MAG: chitosanase [Euryarchaeota archaeon]|nr:chitosanase [Euryarchaeota archaeon]
MQNTISKTICILILAFLAMSVTGAAATCTPCKAKADSFVFNLSMNHGNVLSNDIGSRINVICMSKCKNGGKVSMTYNSGDFVYAPPKGSTGIIHDSFTYTIANRCSQKSTAKVSLTYNNSTGSNKPPGNAGTANGYTPAYGAMMQMISCAENDMTDIDWGYCQINPDGHGVTAGLGFCSGTYDLNQMVHIYQTLNPNNPLVSYIPDLDAIDKLPHNSDGVTDVTTGLEDWVGTNEPYYNNGIFGRCLISDPQNFKLAQLKQWNTECYTPAMDKFNAIGGKYNFTWALMCDAAEREGSDGMLRFANAATSATGGTPKTGKSEVTWDRNFMSAYTAQLKSDGYGDESRMQGWTAVLNSGNYALNVPFKFSQYGLSFTIIGYIGSIPTVGGSTSNS